MPKWWARFVLTYDVLNYKTYSITYAVENTQICDGRNTFMKWIHIFLRERKICFSILEHAALQNFTTYRIAFDANEWFVYSYGFVALYNH